MTLPHQHRSLTLVSLLNFKKFRFSFKNINDKWSNGFTGNSGLKSDLKSDLQVGFKIGFTSQSDLQENEFDTSLSEKK